MFVCIGGGGGGGGANGAGGEDLLNRSCMHWRKSYRLEIVAAYFSRFPTDSDGKSKGALIFIVDLWLTWAHT